jgi:hypothetical protein
VLREEGYNPKMLGLMPGVPNAIVDTGIKLNGQ